jgi:hypothetical protein
VFDITGVIDLHVHSDPDVNRRAADDVEIARLCASYGMAGMAVKAHVESSASRAYLTNLAVPGFRSIGGVTLNYPVGGINPAAVEANFLLGGRIVWMPSGHSRFHAELTGTLGTWSGSGISLPTPRGATGIRILDDSGALIPEVKDVVSLTKQFDGLICTSHLSPEEGLALIRHCGSEGVKSMVTHIGWTPEFDVAYAEAAVEAGGMIEFAASSMSGYTIRFPLEQAVELMRRIGFDRAIASSDTGGTLSPLPHESMRVLAERLLHSGVAEHDVRTMMVANPERLIAG